MRDFLLLCSTLALLLSGFIVMNRLDCWIEQTKQRILEELPKDEPIKTAENTPEPVKNRESLWIREPFYDKIVLPKHATGYGGTGQCSSCKKGI